MGPWQTLLLAAVFEVGMTTFLRLEKRSGWWVLAFLPCAWISFTLLSEAARTLPLGLAYAVWTGAGAIGTVIVGWVGFGDRLSRSSLLALGLALACLVGLKVVQ